MMRHWRMSCIPRFCPACRIRLCMEGGTVRCAERPPKELPADCSAGHRGSADGAAGARGPRGARAEAGRAKAQEARDGVVGAGRAGAVHMVGRHHAAGAQTRGTLSDAKPDRAACLSGQAAIALRPPAAGTLELPRCTGRPAPAAQVESGPVVRKPRAAVRFVPARPGGRPRAPRRAEARAGARRARCCASSCGR